MSSFYSLKKYMSKHYCVLVISVIVYLSMQVNFIAKLVALKPGKTVQEMIKNVMLGKDEGAEDAASEEENISSERISSGIAGRVWFT